MHFALKLRSLRLRSIVSHSAKLCVALALVGGVVVGPNSAEIASAAQGSQSFGATGSDQTFTVPAGVTEVQVYLRGGGGGSNQYNYGSPGKGAYVSSVLTVTPGETLTIVVGAAGAQASSTGVYGGGGAGGTTAWYSATGGGGSDIRRGGSAVANRVVVAGGGGGNNGFANGGNGGTPNGVNGLQESSSGSNAQGGRGGTQSAGGAGGLAAGGNCYTENGAAGSPGQGGRGGLYPGGSGGGGGYYGGGGGGSGCNSGSGGGGSSYADPVVAANTLYSLASFIGAGCIEVAWPAGTSASSCSTTAPDTTAPTFSSSTPADNATGVSLSVNIALTFSENVFGVTGKNVIVKKTSDNSIVETISTTSSQVSISGSTATINPSADFVYSTGYYVMVEAGAFADTANNGVAGISDSSALNFSTLADIVAPLLSSSSPADNASTVGIASNIVLSFSEAVTAVAGKNLVLMRSSDNVVIQSFSATGSRVMISGGSVTIDPTDDLEYSTSYYLTIDAGALKDGANNNYVGISSATALNFTTGADTTAPTLTSSTPADNASGVALNASISLQFSEPVTATTGKNITLKKSSDNSTVQTFSVTGAGVTISGSTVTVNPSSNLSYSIGYYLLIDSGAFKDGSSNLYTGISSSSALNFTAIADLSIPTLMSTSPADNATGVALASNITIVFSENVFAVSGKNIIIKKSSDGSTVETLSVTNGSRVSISDDTVIVNPTSPFENGLGYYVLIDSGAFRDSAANDFAGITSTSALNFTVISAVTTTTEAQAPETAPIPTTSTSTSSTSTTISANVNTGATSAGSIQSTSTTIQNSVAQRGTPTTTLPAPSSAAVSSTTTTTTTIATNDGEAAPDAPAADPGTATAFINGESVQMALTRSNNNLMISSGNLQLQVGIYDESGQIVPLDSDGNAVIEQGSQIDYQVTGAQPGALLEAWLFSDPFKLGSVLVGGNGRAEGRLPVSVEVPAGAHRLVLKTLTAGGEEATVAIGVISGASDSPATLGRILLAVLLIAISFGLIIPATRRRRRKGIVA